MKKIPRLFLCMLAFTIVMCSMVSSAAAYPAEPAASESAQDADGINVVVRTWEAEDGGTVTGVITRRVPPLSVRTMEAGATGVIMSRYGAAAAPRALDEREVSDYFYFQILDNNNRVASEYKVTLAGVVSRVDSSRRITSVEFARVSGDRCETNYSISGYTAMASITHSQYGVMAGYFVLGSGGAFTVY